ncbi:MAG: hypothetical protein ACTHNW_18720 [Mucilaginibacter sp.]
MTTLELKTAIHQAVEKVPEDALQEIFDFINSVQQTAHDDDKVYGLINKIIEEESNVLRRLAE